MRRFFTDPAYVDENTAQIIEDAEHITRVLRMKVGDEILLFDGTGYEYKAVLTVIDSKECQAKILGKYHSAQEPQIQVTIFQGLPKSGKMEVIIQKAVELGVFDIVPMITERCVAKMETDKKVTEKLKRWNRIALEAAKQCGRGRVPQVLPPVPFHTAVQKAVNMDLGLMPYEILGHQGDRSLKKILQSVSCKNIGILIGPEGGFSDAEAEQAKQMGIMLTGLGKRILRTETVSGTLLSIIMYEKNEM